MRGEESQSAPAPSSRPGPGPGPGPGPESGAARGLGAHQESEPPEHAPGWIRLAPTIRIPIGAVTFSASRSSGPGGQNVNKVSSKVELRVWLADLPIPQDALGRLRKLAGRRVTLGGELVLAAEASRSQRQNRQACIDQLSELVTRALVRPKTRRATSPTKGSKERRLDAKKKSGDRKRNRKGSDWDS